MPTTGIVSAFLQRSWHTLVASVLRCTGLAGATLVAAVACLTGMVRLQNILLSLPSAALRAAPPAHWLLPSRAVLALVAHLRCRRGMPLLRDARDNGAAVSRHR